MSSSSGSSSSGRAVVLGLHDPDNLFTRIFRNVGKHLQIGKAQHYGIFSPLFPNSHIFDVDRQSVWPFTWVRCRLKRNGLRNEL